MYNKGQKLVCISNKTDFEWVDGHEPNKDEIVTFNGPFKDGLSLLEYMFDGDEEPQAFNFKHFIPLDVIKELTSSFTEIKETSDNPISIPQNV